MKPCFWICGCSYCEQFLDISSEVTILLFPRIALRLVGDQSKTFWISSPARVSKKSNICLFIFIELDPTTKKMKDSAEEGTE